MQRVLSSGISLAVIDAAAGKLENQVRLPICPEKPVAAPQQLPQPSLILFGDHALAGTDHALIEFAICDGAQAKPGNAIGDRPGDPAVLAASGETAYATIHLNTACAAETGNETAWNQLPVDLARNGACSRMPPSLTGSPPAQAGSHCERAST